jgi:hypothetical protein
MEVDSELPDAPDLTLGALAFNDSPVQIRGIDGLGPAKANVQSTPFATARGEFFQGSNTGTRNIVLTLGLNSNWFDQSVMALRQILYRYFMPEASPTLRFLSDELPTVRTDGIVESFEPNIFSDDPEVQISIICSRPDFVAIDETDLSGTTGSSVVTVDYEGTQSAGFTLQIADPFDSDIEVTNEIGSRSQDFLVHDVSLPSGHIFELNTLHGQRHVRNIAGDDTYHNLLHKSEADATWPEFSPGSNSLKVMTPDASVDWTLSYFARYGGL